MSKFHTNSQYDHIRYIHNIQPYSASKIKIWYRKLVKVSEQDTEYNFNRYKEELPPKRNLVAMRIAG